MVIIFYFLIDIDITNMEQKSPSDTHEIWYGFYRKSKSGNIFRSVWFNVEDSTSQRIESMNHLIFYKKIEKRLMHSDELFMLSLI